MSWSQCFSHGNKMQEVFVEYMEDNYGYKFLAGDRNGKTQNIDYIEETLRCQYISPQREINGPMVRMKCSDGIYRNFVMPDELMISNNKHQLFDVKNRKIGNLFEKYGVLDDYRMVGENSGIPVFISLIIWNNELEKYDVYIRNVRNILAEYTGNRNQNSKVEFDLSKFKKF